MSAVEIDLHTRGVEVPVGRRIEPLNIFTDIVAPRLDADLLPSVIADFAFDRAELIGCDPAAIAFPALVIAGGLLPDAIKIQPKRHDRTWQESARLWHLSVASPASKKTAAVKAAAAPAYRRSVEAMAQHGRALSGFSPELPRFNGLDYRSRAGNQAGETTRLAI